MDTKKLFALILLSILIFTSCVQSDNESPNKDTIHKRVFNVEKIKLEHTPKEKWKGIYSWERARCSGLKIVNYKNYDHYYMGSGATLSIPESGENSSYTVTERLMPNVSSKWPEKVILEIIDNSNRDILAKREVFKSGHRYKGIEGIYGYKGDIAAKFVRKVLSPKQKAWSSTCTTMYPKTDFDVDVSEVEFSISKEQLFSKATHCKDISINAHETQNDFRVSSPTWIYKTRSHPDHVYCKGKDVFVFSSVFWHELHIDWLDRSGILKGQYRVTNRNKLVTADLVYDFIESVEVSKNRITVKQVQIEPKLKNNDHYSGEAVQSIFRIDTIKSQGRNHWCQNTGESFARYNEKLQCVKITPPNPIANN